MSAPLQDDELDHLIERHIQRWRKADAEVQARLALAGIDEDAINEAYLDPVEPEQVTPAPRERWWPIVRLMRGRA
jgi:hypothetical protein